MTIDKKTIDDLCDAAQSAIIDIAIHLSHTDTYGEEAFYVEQLSRLGHILDVATGLEAKHHAERRANVDGGVQ